MSDSFKEITQENFIGQHKKGASHFGYIKMTEGITLLISGTILCTEDNFNNVSMFQTLGDVSLESLSNSTPIFVAPGSYVSRKSSEFSPKMVKVERCRVPHKDELTWYHRQSTI